jgi:hypothetical protein
MSRPGSSELKQRLGAAAAAGAAVENADGSAVVEKIQDDWMWTVASLGGVLLMCKHLQSTYSAYSLYARLWSLILLINLFEASNRWYLGRNECERVSLA